MPTTEYSGCTDCCGPPNCDCAPPSTLYADFVSSCSGMSASACPLVYGLYSATKWGAALGDGTPSAMSLVELYCSGGIWYLDITYLPADCVFNTQSASTGNCDPFAMTFTVTLDSACCPASGGTVAVSVSE